MSEPRPDALMSPDGTRGWFAYLPDGSRPAASDDDAWSPPREGSVIRLMGEYGADVPLWGEDGLLFLDRDELVREWTLSDDLVDDLVRWGLAWEEHAGERDHDADGADLARRLRRELGQRYRMFFHP
ncbi:hypothetical protein [Nocardioides flavescens]|uniref:Uncharacterized protein n=1 Tax=Nocardioides flavescens TaxID=2691959 RepID=A0A6L7F1Q8_9ACTN|nr:hypothetical protein [Nocardioides flavescens]MXG90881.1 hypothetical protein [Nocardioides flavescens]